MPKVYVLQDNPYSPKDFTDAKKYGEIKIMFDHHISNHQLEGCIEKLKTMFRDVRGEDYVILVGPPVLVSVAGALCNEHFGRIKTLIWDNRRFEYQPFKIVGLDE